MHEINSTVVFHSKVFYDPYRPYYDEYKNHIFRITQVHTQEPYGDPLEPHYTLICVDDPAITVKGNVHGDELIKIFPLVRTVNV